MTDRKSASALLWFVLGSGVVTTVFFYTPSLDPFNLPKSVLILGGGASVLFALLVSGNLVEKERWVAAIPLFAFMATYTICALIGSDNSRRLLFGAYSRATGLVSYLGMVFLALGALLATRGQKYVALYSALAVVTLFEVTYGFLQFLNVDPIAWNNPYNRVIGSLGNPNFMSATLGFSAVALVSLAFNATTRIWIRITAPTIGIAAFLLALATDSVQGPIAFAGGLALVIGVAIWQWKQKSVLFYSYSTIAGGILLVVLLGVAKIGPLADKLYQYTLGVRTQYWRAALKMMGNSPLYGVGVDSYGENYRLVRDATTFKTVGPGVFTNAAHSVPLQLGATLGIPTLVLYLFLQIFVAYRVYVSFKQFPDQRIAIAGIAGAWLAFQAQSFISIDQLGVGVWGWILTGSLIGGSYAVQNAAPEKRVRRRDVKKSQVAVVSSLATFGLVLGWVIGWQGYVPDLHLRNAIAQPWDKTNQQSISILAAALVEASSAIRQDATYQALAIGELTKMPGTVEQILTLTKRVAKEHPESWDAQNLAAEIMENLGKNSEAVAYRAAQIQLDPANWQPSLAYARDLESLGRKADAITALKRVVALAPSSPEGETATASIQRLGS